MSDLNPPTDFISKFNKVEKTTQTDHRGVAYLGKVKPLLKLGLWTSFLTLLTLGIYRFWARTRVRRYFWSSVAPGGQPFEYTGNGLEKLLGFLIAVAVLAIYLGIFQLLLLFFGYSLFTEAETAAGQVTQALVFYGAFFAVLPLIYYAQYRGRRYLLSRTRWSGVRFGAEKAAWGYVWTSLKNVFVTVITLGILMPRQTFNLEKFRIDRTWFGNSQFHQHGSWKMLIPAAKHYYIGLLLLLVGMMIYGWIMFKTFSGLDLASNDLPNMGGMAIGGIAITFGYIWFAVGIAIYRVASWRTLANNKTLGDRIKFTSEVDTAEVVLAYILGSILASIFAAILALIVAFIVGFAFVTSMPDLSTSPSNAFDLMEVVLVGLIYVSFLLFFGAIALVSIQQPVLRAMATTITIQNANELDIIMQRDGEEFIEAEGFADALDVGAAF